MSYSLPEIPGSYAGVHPMAADAVIEIGGLVAINASGDALAAAAAVTGYVAGRAEESKDNTGGSAGDLTILPKRGIFSCANSATNAVTKAHVGKTVFAESPDIIANTGTCRAGLLLGFDEAGRPVVDTRTAAFSDTAELAATYAEIV